MDTTDTVIDPPEIEAQPQGDGDDGSVTEPTRVAEDQTE